MRAAPLSCFLPVLHATNAHSLLCKKIKIKYYKKELLTLLKTNLQSSPEDLNGQQIAQSFPAIVFSLVAARHEELSILVVLLPFQVVFHVPKSTSQTRCFLTYAQICSRCQDSRLRPPYDDTWPYTPYPNLRFPNLSLIRGCGFFFTTIHKTSFGF
jgi:hypothetical protein